MKIFIIILAVAFTIAAICVIAMELFLRSVAKSESDVNGDPERDAGYTEPEIQKLCAWCMPKKELRPIPGGPQITHGICPKCAQDFKAQSE